MFLTSVKETLKVLENIKDGVDGDIRCFVGGNPEPEDDPIPNIHFTVSGNGKTYRVVSDKKGWFHLSVPPGHYQIRPSDPKWKVRLSDYCWENPGDLDVRTVGGADLGYFAIPNNKKWPY